MHKLYDASKTHEKNIFVNTVGVNCVNNKEKAQQKIVQNKFYEALHKIRLNNT